MLPNVVHILCHFILPTSMETDSLWRFILRTGVSLPDFQHCVTLGKSLATLSLVSLPRHHLDSVTVHVQCWAQCPAHHGPIINAHGYCRDPPFQMRKRRHRVVKFTSLGGVYLAHFRLIDMVFPLSPSLQLFERPFSVEVTLPKNYPGAPTSSSAPATRLILADTAGHLARGTPPSHRLAACVHPLVPTTSPGVCELPECSHHPVARVPKASGLQWILISVQGCAILGLPS